VFSDSFGQSAAAVQQADSGNCGKLLKAFAGEVAERLKAAVC